MVTGKILIMAIRPEVCQLGEGIDKSVKKRGGKRIVIGIIFVVGLDPGYLLMSESDLLHLPAYSAVLGRLSVRKRRDPYDAVPMPMDP